jgi:hypothetical protein
MHRRIRKQSPLRIRKRARDEMKARQRDDRVPERAHAIDQDASGSGERVGHEAQATFYAAASALYFPLMLTAAELTELQDRTTTDWHLAIPEESALLRPFGVDSAEGLLIAQHLANFELWHEEDKARDPRASDMAIAQVKRNIDRLNQRRHDRTEALDELLLDTARREGAWSANAPLNSETPGMMADRMSILSLKIFHTQEEMARPDPPPGHMERNAGRLAVLEEQRRDLAGALDSLWHDATHGKRRFKLYKQLKMYNDAALNPAVYGSRRDG